MLPSSLPPARPKPRGRSTGAAPVPTILIGHKTLSARLLPQNSWSRSPLTPKPSIQGGHSARPSRDRGSAPERRQASWVFLRQQDR